MSAACRWAATCSPCPPARARPRFAVWAVKDPTSGNLDRIQIVKGWTKSGQSFEKVFDVAWAGDREPDKWTGIVPPIGSTVDIDKGTYTNTIGAVELKTVWTDPEFDPSLHAFYYARVLEIPTPRWTTIQAAKLGIAPPDVVPATQQERAWSSPIWYTPTAEARQVAKAGPTVDDLKKQGAVALDDAELKALIVDKSPTLQNNVTGTNFRMIFSASGTANATQTLTPIDPKYVTSKFAANQGQQRFNYAGFAAGPAKRDRRSGGEQLSRAHLALLHQQWQARHPIARHAIRDHRLQARRQILRRAQQRVRLRQLRNHPRAKGVEPAEGDAQGRPALRDAPMRGRRSSLPPRASWLKLCFALALSLISTAAVACPLCYEAARQMMTDGVQLDWADRAVLATREAGGGPLRIVAVVKGSDTLGDAIAEPVAEAAEAASAAGEPSLLLHDPAAPQWTSLGAIPLGDADWLRRIIATREVAGDRPRRTWPLTMSTADALSYAGWRQRVALVPPYLEIANPLAARLAWGELARAPYATMDAARSRVDPASVEAWLDDPKRARRRAAYLTLLGFVGGPYDGARLDQRIETALASHDATDLAAMIAADLELSGPSRVDWIGARIFADRRSTMPEIEAALLALNVLGDANGAAARARG